MTSHAQHVNQVSYTSQHVPGWYRRCKVKQLDEEQQPRPSKQLAGPEKQLRKKGSHTQQANWKPY